MDTNTTNTTTPVKPPPTPNIRPPRTVEEVNALFKPSYYTVKKYRQKEAYEAWCRKWHVTANDIEHFGGPKQHQIERWLRDVLEFSPTELYAFATAMVECIELFNLKKIFKIADPVPTVKEVYEGIKAILDQPRSEDKVYIPTPIKPKRYPIHFDPFYEERREPVHFTPDFSYPVPTIDDLSYNLIENEPVEPRRPYYRGRVAFAPRGMAPRGGM